VEGDTSGTGTAVLGQASGDAVAVYGIASGSNGVGVSGTSQQGLGVYAESNTTDALVAATGSTSYPAILAASPQFMAIEADADGVTAISSLNSNASGFGLLTATPSSGNAYPLVARDTSNNNLFYVDGLGNVFYHGTLNHFLITNTGSVARSFTPTAASPTIEDDGTARLVNGEATVTLDPAFAHSIDLHRVYHVMLTPDGDTRGLYTAVKTPTSFTVREVQGGHGTLDFDYHIYAPSLGQAAVRMREMTRAQAASSGPRAVLAPHPVPQPPLRPHR
jgi:hypothetical protein